MTAFTVQACQLLGLRRPGFFSMTPSVCHLIAATVQARKLSGLRPDFFSTSSERTTKHSGCHLIAATVQPWAHPQVQLPGNQFLPSFNLSSLLRPAGGILKTPSASEMTGHIRHLLAPCAGALLALGFLCLGMHRAKRPALSADPSHARMGMLMKSRQRPNGRFLPLLRRRLFVMIVKQFQLQKLNCSQ